MAGLNPTDKTGSARRRLSVCMIVRDEAEHLRACLESVRHVADELVVVDTGSSDDSRQIAADFGAVLGDHDWNDDFGAARNASLDLATGDWILAIDADQRLEAESVEELRRLVDHGDDAIYLLRQINYAGAGNVVVENLTGRLFPNRPDLRYRGRIHEQIVPASRDLAVAHVPCGIVLHHYGHEAGRDREKASRYIPLIEAQAAEEPAEPFHLYNLGLAHLTLGAHEAAELALRATLDLAFSTLAPQEQPSYLLNARATLAVALVEQGRHAEAAAVCRAALALAPDMPDAWCTLGAAELRGGNASEAFEAYSRAGRCQAGKYQMMHDLNAAGWKASLGMGEACLALARWPEAVAHLEQAVEQAPTSPDVARAVRAGLEAAPEVAGIHRLAARLEAGRGELDLALQHLERTLARDDSDPRTLSLAEKLLNEAGAEHEAQSAAQAARAVASRPAGRRRPRVLFVVCFDPSEVAPMGYIQRLTLLIEAMREVGDVHFFRPTPEVGGTSSPSAVAAAHAMEVACNAAAAHGNLANRRSESLNATAFAACNPETYDIVFLHRLATAWWTGWSDPRRTIIDVDDLPSRTYEQMASVGGPLERALGKLRHARARRSERKLGDAFRALLVASEDDSAYLNHPHATVVPNAYRPHPLMQAPVEAGDGRTMVFVGTFTFQPNVAAMAWFAREVLPRVRREIADAIVVVIGFTPPFRQGDWSWTELPGVRFLGGVRDAGPHVHAASVSVCPLGFGRGTRIKIIEALAFGTPVVSTSIGAFGLPFDERDGVLRRDSADDLAAACIELLRGRSRRLALGQAGRFAAFERAAPEAAKAALRALARSILEEQGLLGEKAADA